MVRLSIQPSSRTRWTKAVNWLCSASAIDPSLAGRCARRERPRRGAGTEQRDELAPFQFIELHSIPTSQGRIAG
jgi:hypothetical protein